MNNFNASLLTIILLVAPHSYAKRSSNAAFNEYKKSQEAEQKNMTYAEKEINEEEKKILAEVFANAPKRLQNIIEFIAKNEEGSEEFKQILLTGNSESNQIALAQAIAYILKKKYLIIDAITFSKLDAIDKLKELFEEIDKHEEKPLLIIRKLELLSSGNFSENSNARYVGTYLADKFDQFKNSEDFLFVGTTTATKKLPRELQSRFRGSTFIV